MTKQTTKCGYDSKSTLLSNASMKM